MGWVCCLVCKTTGSRQINQVILARSHFEQNTIVYHMCFLNTVGQTGMCSIFRCVNSFCPHTTHYSLTLLSATNQISLSLYTSSISPLFFCVPSFTHDSLIHIQWWGRTERNGRAGLMACVLVRAINIQLNVSDNRAGGHQSPSPRQPY